MASSGAGGAASNTSPAPPAADHSGSSAGQRDAVPAGPSHRARGGRRASAARTRATRRATGGRELRGADRATRRGTRGAGPARDRAPAPALAASRPGTGPGPPRRRSCGPRPRDRTPRASPAGGTTRAHAAVHPRFCRLALRALERTQVPDQSAHLGVVQSKRRHADLRLPPADDLLQFVVIQRQQTRGNRRPVLSSLRIASVALSAFLKLVGGRRLILSSGYRNSGQ